MRSVMSMAESMGGYVVNSNQWNSVDSSGKAYAQTSVTIRVPSERLDEAMQKIREMAADAENGVLSESVNGQDVTSDYVDSQSRLRNLEAAEQQLVKLLESATDLQYTLEIFRELTNIRSEIEVLKGHIKYLEESAALSSIAVEFVAEASLQPIQIGPWKPSGEAKKAVQALRAKINKILRKIQRFFISDLLMVLKLYVKDAGRTEMFRRGILYAFRQAVGMPGWNSKL